MKRKLIDHNDSSFSYIKADTNDRLIKILKKAKKEENSTDLAKIMKSAQRGSPYHPHGLNSIGSSIFNKYNGSTGGD